MTIKKFIPQLAIETEFLIAHLQIPEQCKTKSAVGAVHAFLRSWQLGA
jgi:hypothetical protein